MKCLICSDIHGSIESAKILAEKFKELGCDKILCLGDVLYHGPRNDLPPYYAPKEVIEVLNGLKENIICVKGNCEAEVDQMVLNFKIYDSYTENINDCLVHLEHGHHLENYTGTAQLVLFGHTHIPFCENKNGIQYINPGSITLPKENSKRGYAIWENHTITGYDLEHRKVFEYKYE